MSATDSAYVYVWADGVHLRIRQYPKVVKRLTDDEDEPLAFIDFPAEH